MSYDEWKCTDTNADTQAEQEAKIASLAGQVRSGLNLSDFINEIELDASFDTKVCQSVTQAFLEGVNPAIVLHGYALDWLDRHSVELAKKRLGL